MPRDLIEWVKLLLPALVIAISFHVSLKVSMAEQTLQLQYIAKAVERMESRVTVLEDKVGVQGSKQLVLESRVDRLAADIKEK